MAVHIANVFINIPFDNQYERLYLALIASIVGLGAYPRSTLEVPPTKDRLRRIFTLIRSCDISIHDLSRVQLSRSAPRCPRLICHSKQDSLQPNRCRLQKSLSDLNGYEVNVHEGTIEGMVAVLLDIFPYRPSQPGPTELRALCRLLAKAAPEIKIQSNRDLFRPRAFDLLRETAAEFARRTRILL